MGLGCYDEIKHLDSVLGSGRDPKGLAVSSFYKNDFSFHWALVPTYSLLKVCNCVLYLYLCVCVCLFNWIFKGLNENRWFMQFWVIWKNDMWMDINLRPLPILEDKYSSSWCNGSGAISNCGYPDQWFFNPIWSWKHLIHLLHRESLLSQIKISYDEAFIFYKRTLFCTFVSEVDWVREEKA